MTDGNTSPDQTAQDYRSHFTFFAENSPDFIAMASLEGKVLYLNAAGRKLIGLETSGQLPVEYLEDFLAENARGLFSRTILPSIFDLGTWECESTLRHHLTDEPIEVTQNLFLMRDPEDRNPVCLALVVRDLSERRNAEDALRKTQRELLHAQKMENIGRLAGGIAHDFNNLLTAINGYADLSLDHTEPGHILHGNLTEIKMAGERAAALTRQLLA
jgi:PAS domain S-box-containing protein